MKLLIIDNSYYIEFNCPLCDETKYGMVLVPGYNFSYEVWYRGEDQEIAGYHKASSKEEHRTILTLDGKSDKIDTYYFNSKAQHKFLSKQRKKKIRKNKGYI